MGWGDGIPLQEVEVLGGGGMAGRGWELPPRNAPYKGPLGQRPVPAWQGCWTSSRWEGWWGEGCEALRPTWEFF